MKLLNIIKAPEKLRRILAARKLRRRFAAEDPGKPASDVAIEVLIPVIAKDLPTLSLCVESIRSFVRHPIERIRLIARPDAQMNAIAERLNTPILDENDLLSPEARNLDFRVNGHDRSGWIKQQLLKLAADSVVGTDRFLIVDADTAFARDVVFCRDGRDILFCSGGGRHPPLSGSPASSVVIVCHSWPTTCYSITSAWPAYDTRSSSTPAYDGIWQS